MKSSLSLNDIKKYVKENFCFECLGINPTDEFITGFSNEIALIIDESNCESIDEEWYFLSQLICNQYWESVSLELQNE